MDKIQISATVRDLKANPKTLRKSGKLPAVLYGHKVKNTPLAVNTGEFEKAFKKAGESTLVELKTDDGTTHHVLIHDVQHHVLSSQPIHVDFLEVNMTEKLKANVPLEFIGEADPVKVHGGVLVKLLDEVEVECLPADLPHSLQVDISALKTFDDEIRIKDLKAPAKVEITSDAEELVVKVQPPRDVEAELAEPATEDVAAVMEASQKPKEESEEAGEEQK